MSECKLVLIVVLLFLMPEMCFALPIPEIMQIGISSFYFLGYFGALILVPIILALNKKNLLKLLFLVAFLIPLVSFVIQHRELKARNLSDQLSVFFACDYNAHEKRVHGTIDWQNVPQLQNIRRVSFSQAESLYRGTSSQNLWYLNATYARFKSGIPGFVKDNAPHLFQYLTMKQFRERLATPPQGPLFIIGLDNHYFGFRDDPALLRLLKDVSSRIIAVERGTEDSLIPKDRFFKTQSNSVEGAILEPSKTIDWQYFDTQWLLHNEDEIKFPKIANLLSDSVALALLKNPKILIVAAYDSEKRFEDIYVSEYLKSYFGKFDPKRIFIIDSQSADIQNQIAHLAEQISGRPFLMVGITKHDWLYSGIDVGLRLFEHLNFDKSRFLLQGFSPRLPNLLARMTADSRLQQSGWLSWLPLPENFTGLEKTWVTLKANISTIFYQLESQLNIKVPVLVGFFYLLMLLAIKTFGWALGLGNALKSQLLVTLFSKSNVSPEGSAASIISSQVETGYLSLTTLLNLALGILALPLPPLFAEPKWTLPIGFLLCCSFLVRFIVNQNKKPLIDLSVSLFFLILGRIDGWVLGNIWDIFQERWNKRKLSSLRLLQMRWINE